MPFPSSGFARLAGQAGARKRWANATPEQRRIQGEKMRAGRRRRYIEKAASMAAEQGLTPSPQALERAADALQQADLAEYRVRAWKALRGETGGAS